MATPNTNLLSKSSWGLRSHGGVAAAFLWLSKKAASSSARYDYDSAGQLKSAKNYLGAAVSAAAALPGRGFEFTYDDSGNRRTAKIDTETVIYTDGAGTEGGNSLNQVKQRGVLKTHASGTAVAAATVTAGGLTASRKGAYWDAALTYAGQMASVTTSATLGSQSESATGVTTLFRPASETLYYDEDGNLKSDSTWSYVYDAENRLKEMHSQGWVTPQRSLYFTYDYLGRRVRKEVRSSGTTTLDRKFVYDGWNLIAEFDDASNQIVRSYAWGLPQAGGGGAMVLQTHHTGTTLTAYHAAHDGGGNVTALVNTSTGIVGAAYEYGPSGETLRAEVNANLSPGARDALSAQPFRFAAYYTDVETGLIYFGLRFYDASLGRFINRDPLEEAGGANLYGACGNDCINSRDFLGLAEAPTTADNAGKKKPDDDYLPPFWGIPHGIPDGPEGDETQPPDWRNVIPEQAKIDAQPNGTFADRVATTNRILTAPSSEPFFSPAHGAGVMDWVMRNLVSIGGFLAIGGAAGGEYDTPNLERMHSVEMAVGEVQQFWRNVASDFYGVSDDNYDRAIADGYTDLVTIALGVGGVVRSVVVRVGSKTIVNNAPRYIVDESGLTVSAQGRITGSHVGRGKGYRPEPVGGRAPGDHRGHLLPEQGVENPKLVNVRENIISEAPGSNLGPKKAIENFAVRLADQNRNSVVQMSIQPLRQPGQTRPFAVTVTVIQDGRTVRAVTILNK